MKSNPKNQHWVPQFYLREFAIPKTRDTGKEQVWIFSRLHHDDLETKPTNIRNVAAEKFLYSPLQKEGGRSFEGEHMLAQVDGFLSQFWPRIANDFVDWDANQGIRRGLAWFIGLLLARHPDQMDAGVSFHQRMVRMYESAPKDAVGRPKVSGIGIKGTMHEVDNSDWESYRDATDSDVRQFVIDSIRKLTIELTEDIFRKQWAIVFSPHAVFVTSDRPVYLLHSERQNFGTRTAGTRIIFPISPTRLLVAHDDESSVPNKYVHLRRGDELGMNMLTWVHARRFLISPFEPTPLLATMVSESDKFDRIQANRLRQKPVKVGRNESCVCGSGRKFKQCCGGGHPKSLSAAQRKK
jgi:hypothetical protein